MAVGSHVHPLAAAEIGSLALSCVQHETPQLYARAARWRNILAKVGVYAPLWATHDIGLLFVAGSRGSDAALRDRPGLWKNESLRVRAERYAAMIRELMESDVTMRARQSSLSDELIAVVLLRVLGPLCERSFTTRGAPPLPVDPEVYRNVELQFVELARRDIAHEIAFLDGLLAQRIRLMTAIEHIDLDMLRLLGLFGAEASAGSVLELVDVLGALDSPDAADVVQFSMDLIPSVLETKKPSGSQRYSVDGYRGLERRGSLDSLVLSELAFDAELFEQRFFERETLYYAREKQHQEERRLHYLLVDASASMRGQRATFARGLALALTKKFVLQGDGVRVRFFDSRLHEAQQAGRGARKNINIPYILSFRSEKGRNYAKVFRELSTELRKLSQQRVGAPIVYLLTHAQCHIPVDTVDRLREEARLYGIFMLPSTGSLDLEYLDRLDTVQIVDESVLARRETRAQRAFDIVDDVVGPERGRSSRPPRTSDGFRQTT